MGNTQSCGVCEEAYNEIKGVEEEEKAVNKRDEWDGRKGSKQKGNRWLDMLASGAHGVWTLTPRSTAARPQTACFDRTQDAVDVISQVWAISLATELGRRAARFLTIILLLPLLLLLLEWRVRRDY